MPKETIKAVDWALVQCLDDDGFVVCVNSSGKINAHMLVDFVRKYFNENNIDYDTFSYSDLIPYLD